MDDLYDKLIEYANSDYYGFHMPGHKRNTAFAKGENPYKYDITEIDGFDDLHHATDILRREMENTAQFFGADRSRFLINGSTCGILAAISAVSEIKKKIIVARNSHKSVYNAVMVCGLTPIYIYPGIEGVYDVSEIQDILEKNSDIAAVVITSPTYEGIVYDVQNICRMVHEYGAPLIVDQAHGAHFGINGFFPVSAVELGADIVIMSLHKTLPSLTQTALLHMNGKMVDYRKVDKYLSVYQTSSPSYVLMGSITNCVHLLQEKGTAMFQEYVDMVQEFLSSCANLKNIHIYTKADAEREGAFDFDRSKIVMILKKAFLNQSLNGRWLYNTLLETYHLQMEMAAPEYVVAMTSPADKWEGFSRLAVALSEIDEQLEALKKDTESHVVQKTEEDEIYCKLYRDGEGVCAGRLPGVSKYIGNADVEMTPHDAAAAETEKVKFADSEGRVSAEYIYIYPPGIPLAVPGERITERIIARVEGYRRQGFDVLGPEYSSIEKIKVVKK